MITDPDPRTGQQPRRVEVAPRGPSCSVIIEVRMHVDQRAGTT